METLGDVAAHCRHFLRRSKAANTIRAYRSDWLDFQGWCGSRGFVYMPAEAGTVAMYLTSLAGYDYKVSTIQRRATAIAQAHEAAGFEPPTRAAVVRILMSGIRRERGTRQIGKAPLLTANIRTISSLLPKSCTGIRDRALLLLGYAGGFRRSELVSLDWDDVEFNSEGLVITLRRSKTDQEGEGRKIVSFR